VKVRGLLPYLTTCMMLGTTAASSASKSNQVERWGEQAEQVRSAS